MNINIKQTIPPKWEVIREVRADIQRTMTSHFSDNGLIDSVVMCSTELLENAIKYSPDSGSEESIEFILSITDKDIEIKTTNTCHSSDDRKTVFQYISSVNDAKDPKELYVEKMKGLMKQSDSEKSQLGLYRIAYEGKFTLGFSIEHERLTVSAHKKIS